mmetsp:Transcript_38262/g.89854  ORF Transcript_38262/g.89854 Transcript_38262/m.89854 type:complete len:425 (+) Transcript_38262:117-1391(+)
MPDSEAGADASTQEPAPAETMPAASEGSADAAAEAGTSAADEAPAAVATAGEGAGDAASATEAAATEAGDAPHDESAGDKAAEEQTEDAPDKDADPSMGAQEEDDSGRVDASGDGGETATAEDLPEDGQAADTRGGRRRTDLDKKLGTALDDLVEPVKRRRGRRSRSRSRGENGWVRGRGRNGKRGRAEDHALNNTHCFFSNESLFVVKLHRTEVVTLQPKKPAEDAAPDEEASPTVAVKLDSGGFHTIETRYVLAQALSVVDITLNEEWALEGEDLSEQEFKDGMEFDLKAKFEETANAIKEHFHGLWQSSQNDAERRGGRWSNQDRSASRERDHRKPPYGAPPPGWPYGPPPPGGLPPPGYYPPPGWPMPVPGWGPYRGMMHPPGMPRGYPPPRPYPDPAHVYMHPHGGRPGQRDPPPGVYQ